MKVLVLNCGSSSVKYKLYDMGGGGVLGQGGVEKVGMRGSFLKLTLSGGEKKVLEKDLPEHTAAIEFILSMLVDGEVGCVKRLDEIEAVGHRVVHGGEWFGASVEINAEVKARLVECIDMAPLHNPPNLKGIEAMEKLLPGVRQVAVFDTAFHQTMPSYAYMYGLPYFCYEKYGIRRYGFHGTSHRYVSRRACEYLSLPYEHQRIITAHIGNGGSVTAIEKGKSVDTSMGLTPVEGLLMGTRCGDVDAGALTLLMEKEGLDYKSLSEVLNRQSGVLGLSGVSSDMRDIDAAIQGGHARAKLALEVYNYRIRKYVGAYTAVLGGCDILVFTGGVGENQWSTRQAVCEKMEYMGMKLDVEKNKSVQGTEAVISEAGSKVSIVVIPTDEELTIATDTLTIIEKSK
ncbi:MAG: acetate kinase [Tannerellaceae bacterium]|nr:acetate kinase [Tannerellaceae bacterium]